MDMCAIKVYYIIIIIIINCFIVFGLAAKFGFKWVGRMVRVSSTRLPDWSPGQQERIEVVPVCCHQAALAVNFV
jgi:hypothetical protein